MYKNEHDNLKRVVFTVWKIETYSDTIDWLDREGLSEEMTVSLEMVDRVKPCDNWIIPVKEREICSRWKPNSSMAEVWFHKSICSRSHPNMYVGARKDVDPSRRNTRYVYQWIRNSTLSNITFNTRYYSSHFIEK